MIRLLLVLAMAGTHSAAQTTADSLEALQSRVTAAEEAEANGHNDDAIALYIAISATKPQPANADSVPYNRIISNAALHAATLLEPNCTTSDDTEARSKTIAQYEIARNTGDTEQKALAANNMAFFLWRCKILTPDPASLMNSIRFDDLGEKLRASYLDNYAGLLERYAQVFEEPSSPIAAQLLEQYTRSFGPFSSPGDASRSSWKNAADQYYRALSSTPTDATALAGITRLLDKLPDPPAFAANVTDLLVRAERGGSGIDLLLKAIKTKKISNSNCSQPLASLFRAFAAGGVTVDEFKKAYAAALAEMATENDMAKPLVMELNRAFLGNVSVIGAPGKDSVDGSYPGPMCRLGRPILPLPLASGVDHMLTAPFQSPQSKSLLRLFPQILELGENEALSGLLQGVATACVRRKEPDVDCAAQKFAAAWLLYPGNTSAAVDLALLVKSDQFPGTADRAAAFRDFLNNTIAPFYAPAGRLKALYSDPSQRVAAQMKPEQNDDLKRFFALIGRPQDAPASPPSGAGTEAPETLRVSPIHDGDLAITGTAPQKWEALRIEVIQTAGQRDCPDAPSRISALALTNAATGAFSASVNRSLAKGQTVCVYGVQNGAPEKAVPQKVRNIPWMRRSHTYIAGGLFWSRVAGAQHFLARAAFDKDYNLARWGYDRYQEHTNVPYPALTTLVNVFAEWRITAIPKQTQTATTVQNGVTNVQSLEFGGYVPLFTRRFTWTFKDHQRAFFFAPLVKGGVDFFPSVGPQSAFSSGVRLGVLKMLSSTSFVPPELQSYIDVAYGNSTNLVVTPELGTRARAQQLNVTGMLKIPETPFYLGMNATAGPGPKQTGIFAGFRIDFWRLLRGTAH